MRKTPMAKFGYWSPFLGSESKINISEYFEFAKPSKKLVRIGSWSRETPVGIEPTLNRVAAGCLPIRPRRLECQNRRGRL